MAGSARAACARCRAISWSASRRSAGTKPRFTGARTVGADARDKLDRDTLKNEYDRHNTDIALEVKEKRIDASKEIELTSANERAYQEKLAVVALARRVRLYEQIADLNQQELGFQREHIQNQQAFATSSAARLRLSLEALDVDQKAERDAAVATIFSPDPNVSDAERQKAGATLRTNQARFDEQRAVQRQQNLSPGASYLHGLKFDAEDQKDFIETEQVKLLDDFNKGLDDSAKKALHLHGIFGDIVGDLIDMLIKQELIKPLANAFFGGGSAGGGGFGGLLGGAAKLLGLGGGSGSFGFSGAGSITPSGITDLSGLLGWADGGSGVIGGNPGMDRNILSLNGTPIRKVGQGELLTVSPNIGPINGRVESPSIREGDRHVHVAVYAQNSVTPAGFAAGLAREILTEADKMDARREGSTLKAAPGRLQSFQTLAT